MEIVDYPARNEQILRNFEIILPKFHLILPNFYFGPPWGNFVSSLTLPDFLGSRVTAVGTHDLCVRCVKARRVTVVGTHDLCVRPR